MVTDRNRFHNIVCVNEPLYFVVPLAAEEVIWKYTFSVDLVWRLQSVTDDDNNSLTIQNGEIFTTSPMIGLLFSKEYIDSCHRYHVVSRSTFPSFVTKYCVQTPAIWVHTTTTDILL